MLKNKMTDANGLIGGLVSPELPGVAFVTSLAAPVLAHELLHSTGVAHSSETNVESIHGNHTMQRSDSLQPEI
jgi:hypothetical protein